MQYGGVFQPPEDFIRNTRVRCVVHSVFIPFADLGVFKVSLVLGKSESHFAWRCPNTSMLLTLGEQKYCNE